MNNPKENNKGDKGDTGDRGFTGLRGDSGYRGYVGDRGDRGDVGDKGEKGDKGDTMEIMKKIKLSLQQLISIIIFVFGLGIAWWGIHIDIQAINSTLRGQYNTSVRVSEVQMWVLKAQLANRTNNVIFPTYDDIIKRDTEWPVNNSQSSTTISGFESISHNP